MGQGQLITIERDLQQIADMLLLNGTLTECPGLVHGKIGIAVFFFHYAKYTGNELFADYAMDVICEMMNQMHINSPADYEKGLAGIGVGIDYLIQNEFLKVEDDICEDFDQRMVRAVMYDPWQDFSLYNGLTGYGRYWMTRLRYQTPSMLAQECLLRIVTLIEEKLPNISIEEQTDVHCLLHDLQGISGFERCKQLLEHTRKVWGLQSMKGSQLFWRMRESFIGNIIQIYQCSQYFDDSLKSNVDIALQKIPDLDMEKPPSGTGLLNGYAGEGMMRLTALNQADMLWMNLL